MSAANMRKIRRFLRVIEMYDKQIEAKLQIKAEFMQEKQLCELRIVKLSEEHAREIEILQHEMEAHVAMTYSYSDLNKVFQAKITASKEEIVKIQIKIDLVVAEITEIYIKKQKIDHIVKKNLAIIAHREEKQTADSIDELSSLSNFFA